MRVFLLALFAIGCGGSQWPTFLDDDWCLAPGYGVDRLKDGWRDAVAEGNNVWREAGVPEMDLRGSCPWPLTVEDDLGPGVLGRARSKFFAGERVAGWVKLDRSARLMYTDESDCESRANRLLSNLIAHELGHFAGATFPDNPEDPAHSLTGVMSRYVHPLCDVKEPTSKELSRVALAVDQWAGSDLRDVDPGLTVEIEVTSYADGTCEHEVIQ